ncbi:hypothetical protein IWW55_003281 [Coemansia sp. RSA 2706]|nr:hypothetical protein LPJ70_001040 [Coemansia sp. RSA 2708]KAJ2302727.1 hypothetical protein IWW55_003281 [Coemansia sp. RSA 2706]KAJ2309403.1 hypothetical protein IWW52_005697 [Coemansia sp. RSA 2704]KAJ2315546.1 hypothetical protein IWW54_000204 [Coemansia sp. RSA 2705]KAJ2330060.1 hypothetical protein IWW51_000201 [Coemansia sp. RSA 2702]KAJ2365938.1 hypothetical protein H4S01_002980 [Coemansia sp. RSA 2610]KAJ2389390.1 hypothetical protein H4S02_002390 [Coemansia sp. RSA 2611]KAJ272075
MKFRYHSALTQVIIVGLVCFLCPGMFNAINGMGGGGQLDPTAGNNANTALYSTFVVFGVLGGAIVNLCGVRWTIFCSGFMYALYSASYIFLNHKPDNGSFTIAAGALLGAGAGILWAAQGMIMVSYPSEADKGKFIAWFWAIFNCGGAVGGIILFAINYHTEKDSLADGVYVVFVVLECIGAMLGLALAPPAKVTRSDGSSVVLVKYTNAGKEAIGILKLFIDPMMLGLLPMCFTSNFFYTYQFNNINAALFNLRTRGFNNMFYWFLQSVASWVFSYLLDNKHMTRRTRGLISFGIVFVFFNAIWGGSLALHNKYPTGIESGHRLDFKDSKRAAGPIILYMVCGIGDAIFQNLAYWIIGALTNDNQKLSRYAGYYKGMQSFGAAIAWQLDIKVKPLNQLIGNWVLFGVSLPSMLYVIWKIKEHSEDTKMPSETEDFAEKDQALQV